MGRVIDDVTANTTAGWVTIISTQFYNEFAKLLVHVFETAGAQTIQYRVQASNDSGFAGVETLADSAGNVAWTVAASGSDFQSICDCWGWIRVQVTNGSGVAGARCIISGTT